MGKSNILSETGGPTKLAGMAAKLYGDSQDRGVPITKVKPASTNQGKPRKVRLVPKKATQTNPKGGI